MSPAARLDRIGTWAAVGIGASVPVSVALDNALLAVVLAAWLLGGAWREKLAFVRGNPVVLAALALFGMLALATAWSEGGARDAGLYLLKYLDLLLVAPLAWQLRAPAARRHALHAFAGSLALVLLLSWLVKAGLVPGGRPLLGSPENPVVFKHYLTHSLLMAYAAFLFVELALAAASGRTRALLLAGATLAAANVLFLVQGRTGYLVLAALALYAGWRITGWRGLAAAAAAVLAITAGLLAVPGKFHDRWQTAEREIQGWRGIAPADSSAALRLEYYRNTLAIVRDHPLTGVGTGGFPAAYAARVAGTGAVATRNPHNEFLHIAAQAGLAGFALLVGLFYAQWRHGARLAAPLERHLARALVLTIATGCLFNSLLLDHTEGLLFAWLTGVLYAGLPPGSGRG